MKYYIKTDDDKYYIGYNGEFITKDKKERATYHTKKLAQWYVANTSLFGKLEILKIDS